MTPSHDPLMARQVAPPTLLLLATLLALAGCSASRTSPQGGMKAIEPAAAASPASEAPASSQATSSPGRASALPEYVLAPATSPASYGPTPRRYYATVARV